MQIYEKYLAFQGDDPYHDSDINEREMLLLQSANYLATQMGVANLIYLHRKIGN